LVIDLGLEAHLPQSLAINQQPRVLLQQLYAICGNTYIELGTHEPAE
jgi:hypothetical protein